RSSHRYHGNYHRIPNVPCSPNNRAGADHLYRGLAAEDGRDGDCAGDQAATGNQRGMVSDSYGPAFNCLRDHALVEPAPRRTRSCVAHWVLCDCVWNPRDHSGLPLAQLTDITCALVSRKLVRPLSLASGLKLGTKEYEEDRQTAWRWVGLRGSRGRDVFPSHLDRSSGKMRFLRYQMHLQLFCWKKMRLGVLDWAITLRLWSMDRLMFCVGFAAAKISRFF